MNAQTATEPSVTVSELSWARFNMGCSWQGHYSAHLHLGCGKRRQTATGAYNDAETAACVLVDASQWVIPGAVSRLQPDVGQAELVCYFVLEPFAMHWLVPAQTRRVSI
jgi:hypothetical protein